MSGISQAQLDELVFGALNENPITCGTVTRLVNASLAISNSYSGSGVPRSAVQRSLERLQSRGKVGYVWNLCERKGFMVNGRHW